MTGKTYVKRIGLLVLRSVAVFWVLATLGLLALNAWHFKPVRSGTSAEYWEYLCGVQLPAFEGHHQFSYYGGAYPVVDGRAYYYTQRQHGSLLFSVPVEDVLQDLPIVQEHLTNPQPPPSSNCVGYDSVCELYKESAGKRSECVNYFATFKVDAMDPPALEKLRITIGKAAKRPTYNETDDAELRGRLGRAKRAWAAFAFEGLYLGAWLIFVVGFRPLRVRWYWRAAFAPFLLFLPMFLGYAPMSLTYGPSGGFVYPVYLMLASFPMSIVPCSALDGFAARFFPDLLSGLSQLPGSPMAATITACVGPVSSLVFGLLLLAGVSVVIYVVRDFRSGRQRAGVF